jgi:hypothetical protein
MGDILWRDWEVVYFVCELVVGLNGCNVRVYQDGFDTGFFESFESLGACRSDQMGSGLVEGASDVGCMGMLHDLCFLVP